MAEATYPLAVYDEVLEFKERVCLDMLAELGDLSQELHTDSVVP
jgi:hypothetical protein